MLYLAPAYLLAPFKVVGAVIVLVSASSLLATLIILRSILFPSRDAYLESPLFLLIQKVLMLVSRLLAFTVGVGSIKVEYVSSDEGDYSKFLGSDWQPEWSDPSTIVCNHVSWLDYLITYSLFKPSYLAKHQTLSSFLAGPFCKAIDCLFLDPKIAFA